jgi:hypothetical protein
MTFSESVTIAIDCRDDYTFSFGTSQVKPFVSKLILRTFQNFEKSKALSKFGHGSTSSTFIALLSDLYFIHNSLYHPEAFGAPTGVL